MVPGLLGPFIMVRPLKRGGNRVHKILANCDEILLEREGRPSVVEGFPVTLNQVPGVSKSHRMFLKVLYSKRLLGVIQEPPE